MSEKLSYLGATDSLPQKLSPGEARYQMHKGGKRKKSSGKPEKKGGQD